MTTRFWATSLALVALATAPAWANGPELVTNGGFETGTFAGWTLSGNLGFVSIVTSPVNSGNFAASFGAIGSDTHLDQILSTTVGQQYELSFWLRNDGGTPNDFAANVSVGAFNFSIVNGPAQPYTHYDFFFTANAAPSDLMFNFRQDPAFWQIDDISVSSVPEPSSVILFTTVVGILAFAFRRREQHQN